MNKNFTVTVGVSPNDTNLTNELKYIKSSILFADKVNVISPLADMYLQMTDSSLYNSPIKAIKLIKMVSDYCYGENDSSMQYRLKELKKLENILLSRQYKMTPKNYKNEVKEFLFTFVSEISEVLCKTIGHDDCNELNRLVKLNLISVDEFKNQISAAQKCGEEFFDKLSKSLNNNSYPVFDEASNKLMRLAVKEGIIDLKSSNTIMYKNASFSNLLMYNLPSFDMMSVDEIVDIKKELNNSVIRFRSKTLEFSNKINAIPWDKDFESECQLIYDKEVLPEIIGIDEQVKSNSFIKNLGLNFVSDKNFLKTTGGLVIGVASSGVIESMLNVGKIDTALMLTGGACIINKVANEYQSYKKEAKIIENKDLYFYYKLYSN